MTMLTLLIIIILLLITIVGLLVYRPQHKKSTKEVFSEKDADKHLLELAIKYIHDETLMYQANLQQAIEFIESLDVDFNNKQKVTLSDIKSEEVDLRHRYTPEKLQAGIVSALQDYITCSVRDHERQEVNLNMESSIILPERMLTYYYGIISIVLDNIINPPSGTYCQINIGQNEKMAWAEIVTNANINLEEKLTVKNNEHDREIIALIYRKLLNANWKWFRKEDYLHFYLHVPYDVKRYSKKNMSA